MIMGLLIVAMFTMVISIVNMIPDLSQVSSTVGTTFYHFLQIGCYFFGAQNFYLVITCVLSWASIDLIWAIIEWSYKKAPGVD